MVPRAVPEPKPVKLEPHTDPYDAVKWWRYQLDKPRFVYFIQEGDDGPVKIGEAFDPASRLRDLQCGNPRTLKLQAVVFATDQTEDRLHMKWVDARVRGEWFQSDILIQIATDVQRLQIEAVGTRPMHDVAFMAEWNITPTHLGWKKAA